MKSVLNYFVATWLAFVSLIGQAAMEEGGKLAPEPTVSVVWVGVFVALFVGVCVWIGVAIFLADRKSKKEQGK